jgi:hypothetical protein
MGGFGELVLEPGIFQERDELSQLPKLASLHEVTMFASA